jgi:hypothetical protein
MTHRRNRKPRVDPTDPVRVARGLPKRLRSFEDWYYTGRDRFGVANGTPAGLRDYLGALSDYLRELFGFAPDAPSSDAVMRAAGLSAADWYLVMLSREESSRPSLFVLQDPP